MGFSREADQRINWRNKKSSPRELDQLSADATVVALRILFPHAADPLQQLHPRWKARSSIEVKRNIVRSALAEWLSAHRCVFS
jgi:hypothetical protein